MINEVTSRVLNRTSGAARQNHLCFCATHKERCYGQKPPSRTSFLALVLWDLVSVVELSDGTSCSVNELRILDDSNIKSERRHDEGLGDETDCSILLRQVPFPHF